jgi:uncharacterized protein YdaU (DUF1376 family)
LVDSSIDSFWLDQLNRVTVKRAKDQLKNLVPDNAMGYSSGKGKDASTVTQKMSVMQQQMINEKKMHKDKVILFRVGEFYETIGVDAVMLMNYASLAPMGGRPRAGCPST